METAVTKSPSGFATPIITIPYKGTVSAPLPAQAKDRMLWYKGKKLNDSILITPDAGLILYSSKRNLVIVQPPIKKDIFQPLVKELQQTAKRKAAFFDKIATRPGNVTFYPAIVNALAEYDALAEKYSRALSNTITLPEIETTVFHISNQRTGGSAAALISLKFAIPEYILRSYKELMAKAKAYPSIDFPAPPITDFGSCMNFNCDSNARKDSDEQVAEWQKSFIKYENEIINTSLAIISKLEQLNLTATPEAITIMQDVEKTMEFGYARIRNKIELLLRKYGNDFSRISSIIPVVLGIERQKQLLDATTDEKNVGLTMEKIRSLFDLYDNFLKQQIAQRRYNVILNIPFHISIERQRQLLGMEEEVDFGLSNYFDQMVAFNRFKLEVQYDYEGQWPGCEEGVAKGNFSANNKQDEYLQLGLIGCRFHFFPTDEYVKKIASFIPTGYHYRYPLEYPIIVSKGYGTELKTKTDGNGDEVCVQEKVNLAGLGFNVYSPVTSIGFCENETEDTILIAGIYNEHDGNKDKREITVNFDILSHSLLDEDELPHELKVLESEAGLMDENHKNTFQMNPDLKLTLQIMEKQFRETSRIHFITKKLVLYEDQANPGIIVFDAKNGEELIIEGTTTRRYTGAYDDAKAKVMIRIKIIHAPLPYNSN